MSVQTTQWEPMAKGSIQLKGGLECWSVVGPLSGMPESLGLSPSRMSKETIAKKYLGQSCGILAGRSRKKGGEMVIAGIPRGPEKCDTWTTPPRKVGESSRPSWDPSLGVRTADEGCRRGTRKHLDEAMSSHGTGTGDDSF